MLSRDSQGLFCCASFHAEARRVTHLRLHSILLHYTGLLGRVNNRYRALLQILLRLLHVPNDLPHAWFIPLLMLLNRLLFYALFLVHLGLLHQTGVTGGGVERVFAGIVAPSGSNVICCDNVCTCTCSRSMPLSRLPILCLMCGCRPRCTLLLRLLLSDGRHLRLFLSSKLLRLLLSSGLLRLQRLLLSSSLLGLLHLLLSSGLLRLMCLLSSDLHSLLLSRSLLHLLRLVHL